MLSIYYLVFRMDSLNSVDKRCSRETHANTRADPNLTLQAHVQQLDDLLMPYRLIDAR